MNDRRLNNVQNKIVKYDDLLYKNGPVSVEDFVSEKQTQVHKQLYQIALTTYIKENIQTKDIGEYKFTEFKNDDYTKPSKVLQVSKIKPYHKKIVDLSPYWPDYKYDDKEMFTSLKIDSSAIDEFQIIKIDYAKGVVTMENRISGSIINVPFNRINSDTVVSDSLTVKNTFYELLQNYINDSV